MAIFGNKAAVTAPAGDAPVEPDPVDPRAWWKTDEGSDTTLADSSGNGYTGFIANGATWVQGPTGAPATAVACNGTNQYLNLTQLGNFGTRVALTFAIDFWFKTSNTNGMARFFGVSNTSASSTVLGVAMQRNSPGDIDVFLRGQQGDSGARMWVTTSTSGFNDNQWHRCQISKSSNTSGGIKIFVDRVQQPLIENDVDGLSVSAQFVRNVTGAAYNALNSLSNYMACSLSDIRFHNSNQDIWIP